MMAESTQSLPLSPHPSEDRSSGGVQEGGCWRGTRQKLTLWGPESWGGLIHLSHFKSLPLPPGSLPS